MDQAVLVLVYVSSKLAQIRVIMSACAAAIDAIERGDAAALELAKADLQRIERTESDHDEAMTEAR